MNALTEARLLAGRRLKATLGQPMFLLISLVQPAVWLFLFGSLFQRVIDLGGFGAGSYLDYIVPGVVVMNALSVNSWAGMNILEEIDRGTLNRFLTLPVRRGAILNATVIEQAASTFIQSAVLLGLGYLAGAEYPGGLGGIALLLLATVALGVVFGALSNSVGMAVRQRESVIGINVFLLLPLTFMSTIFMVKDLMPGWMQVVATFNPLDWAVQIGRSTLGAAPDWGLVVARGAALLALALATTALSSRTFRSYQKAI
jgi:ABC-2 type transport system permease protein